MSRSTQAHPSAEHSVGRKEQAEELRNSPTMARLLDALEAGTDIGHYGQFVFATVARHFLPEAEIVRLLSQQAEMDEERARALLLHVTERGYNPPNRERLLARQAEQKFQIVPDPDDPESGNLYRELRFPEGIFENINDYYEDKLEAKQPTARS